MSYEDPLQVYFFAPWNGISTYIDGEVGAEIDLENLIPILDWIGIRRQWGKSRLADFRAAMGIFLLGDKLRNVDGSTREVVNWTAQANVGLAGFKVGVGVVMNRRAGLSGFRDRMRLLIGYDLVKLISGLNAEIGSL